MIESARRARSRRLLLAAGAGAFVTTFGGWPRIGCAEPAAFPNRPIRFVLPFPPGSGTDISARFFAGELSQRVKQPVIVENHPGGNGFIGANIVLRAPADGYTIFVGATSVFTTNVVVFKSMPFDPVKDFAPVSMMLRSPSVLVVAADAGPSSLKAFVDRAKASPGALNAGTGAVSYQLAAAAFFQRAGVRVNNIPYKGASEVVTAAASGVVDAAIVDIGSALPLVRGGKLRALAVSSDRRVPDLPEVPTYIESGYAGYTTFNWSGAAVPAATPPAIVARLSELFDEIASSPAARSAFEKISSEPVPGGAAEMRRQVASEIERWRGIAAVAGVVPQ